MTRPRFAWLVGFLLGALAVPALLPAQGTGKGVQYALLVGCARYDKAEFPKLPFTGNDVRGFREALRATGSGDGDVVLLDDEAGGPDRRPTRKVILAELDRLLKRLTPQDTLVVALSGHGLQYQGDKVTYFAPVDGDPGDPATLIALTGKGGLYERLAQCKDGRRLLLVNASRDDPGVKPKAAAEPADDGPPGAPPDGVAAIYSCSAGEKSYSDPALKRSYFFEHITRAWKGEYTKGPKVTLNHLMEQVLSKTKADANRALGVRQVPVVKREYRGEWVVNADPRR